jgi:hypothetical protein
MLPELRPAAESARGDEGNSSHPQGGHLQRDLSPWSMFLSADTLVKAGIISLGFASLVTWSNSARMLRQIVKKHFGQAKARELETALANRWTIDFQIADFSRPDGTNRAKVRRRFTNCLSSAIPIFRRSLPVARSGLRAFANARSVARNRSIIGTTNFAGSGAA